MKKRVVSMLLIGCLGAALLVGCGNEKTDANAGGDTNASVGTEAKADTSGKAAPRQPINNMLTTLFFMIFLLL